MKKSFVFWISLPLYFASCSVYEPAPLVPSEIRKEIRLQREVRTSSPEYQSFLISGEMDLRRAATLMAERNVDLKVARQQYQEARKLSLEKTPWPNPELEIGGILATDLGDEGDERRVQPLAAFGFTIPLGGRLARQDELHVLLAERAQLVLLLQHRQSYQKLRRLYVKNLLLKQQLEMQESIIEAAEKSLDITKQLVQAGVATALDVGIVELDLVGEKQKLIALKTDIHKNKGEFSRLTGVSMESSYQLMRENLPTLPAQPMSIEKLEPLMMENQADLLLIKADYKIAEKELEQEISVQTPDLTLRPSFERDPGEDSNIFELSLEFPLPLFDRNEQAILQKKGQRKVLRSQYQASLVQNLSLLRESFDKYLLHQEEWSLNKETLQKAKQNQETASLSLRSGESDFLRYLEAERTRRSSLFEGTIVELDLYLSWFDLEELIGRPLLFFPGEEERDIPTANGLEKLHEVSKGVAKE